MRIRLTFLFVVFLLIRAGAQIVEEGNYNDWDFSPKKVIGNLKLSTVKDRTYFKLEKVDAETIYVKKITPSGININTVKLVYKGGNLEKIEEFDQWNEIISIRTFEKIGGDTYKVFYIIEGENAVLPARYAHYVYKNDLLIETRLFSVAGKLMNNLNGIAIVKYKRYDDKLRFACTKEVAYFDSTESPAVKKDVGYHKVVNVFDEKTNKISERYFNTENIATTINGSRQAGANYFFDKDNNRVKAEFIGLNGALVSNVYGIAGTSFVYEKGYYTKLHRFDSLYHVVRADRSGDGVAITVNAYDKRGNRTSIAYYNEANHPTSSNEGYHLVRYEFNDSDMVKKISYYDDFEKPSTNHNGFHSSLFLRDSVGRKIQVANYKINGEPKETYSEEVNIIRYKYDSLGRVKEESYWADSITPMACWNGYYIIRTSFDEDGRDIMYSYLDQFGQPIIAKSGSSALILTYDELGQLSDRKFMHNGKPVIRLRGAMYGFASIHYGFDINRRVNEISYFDELGKPIDAVIDIDDTFKAHRIVSVYRGSRIIKQEYYIINQSEPVQVRNCLTTDYVSGNGMSIGRKIAN